MSELKPCQFCGSEAKVMRGNAYCPELTCIGCMEEVNVNQWNSRPIEDALRVENERLRKALEEIANHSWYPGLNYGVTIFDPHWYEGKYYDFKEIAREALEVKG